MKAMIKSVFLTIIAFQCFAKAQPDIDVVCNDLFHKIHWLQDHPKDLELLQLGYFNIHADSLDAYMRCISHIRKSGGRTFNSSQQVVLLYETGCVFFKQALLDSALACMDQVIEYLKKDENPKALVEAKYVAGYAALEKGLYKRSNAYFLDVIGQPEMKADVKRYPHCLTFLADNYLNLFQYYESMKYCREAYEGYRNLQDYAQASYVLVMMYHNAYHTEKDTSYLEYLHLANKMAALSGQPGRIGNNLVNTGVAYYRGQMYEKALEYLLKGWNIDKEYSLYGDMYGSTWIAKTYAALNKTGEAYFYAMRTLRKAKIIDGTSWIFDAYDALADCYEKMGMLDSARFCMENAIRIERESGRNPASPDFYKKLSNICLQMDDYPSSISYLDTSYQLYSQVISKDNENALIRLRTKFDYDLQKERIAELQVREELLAERNKRILLLILAVTIILLVTIAFSYFLYRKHLSLKQSYIAIIRKNLEQDNKAEGYVESTDNEPSNGISIRNEDELVGRIRKLLEKDKVFKDQDLSLGSLSGMLDTNTTYLSYVINHHFGMNFKCLIHKYRINEARSMLLSDDFDAYSIEGIASEVGYRSRSSFHQMFKEVIGVTPAAYSKIHRKDTEGN